MFGGEPEPNVASHAFRDPSLVASADVLSGNDEQLRIIAYFPGPHKPNVLFSKA